MSDVQAIASRIVTNVENVIVGKRQPVQLTVLGLLCQGHILIEDVPGVGKTVLAKSISRSVGCDFQRIQFTPDMLPSDVTGVSIFNQKTLEFEFRPDRFTHKSCWPMRSIVPRPKRSQRCWKRWKSAR